MPATSTASGPSARGRRRNAMDITSCIGHTAAAMSWRTWFSYAPVITGKCMKAGGSLSKPTTAGSSRLARSQCSVYRADPTSAPGALPIDPVVAQAVQSHVREISESVVFPADRNLRDHLSIGSVEHVHRRVVAARRPQARALGVQLQHVRAAATWNRPLVHDALRGEVDDGDRSFEAVRHIQRPPVARHLQA